MKFLFIIILAAAVFMPLFIHLGLTKKDKKFSKPFLIGGLAGEAAVIILGIADLFGAFSSSPFSEAFLLMGIVGIAEVLLAFLSIKKDSSTLRFTRKMLIVSMLLEVIVFQMPSYPTAFLSKYTEKAIPVNHAVVQGFGYELIGSKLSIYDSSDVSVECNNVNCPVASVWIDADFGNSTEKLNVWLDMVDETVVDYRNAVASSTIIKDAHYTNYTPCSFSGDVSSLRINLQTKEEYDSVSIKNIIVNKPIPFEILYIRFLLITFLAVFAYAVVNSAYMNRNCEDAKRTLRIWVSEITLIAIAFFVIVTYMLLPDGKFKGEFQLNTGDQMTQELVDSFIEGRLDIDTHYDSALEELENPYDWDSRDGLDYPWDHLLYNSKIYSYYGIAPVVLLYLPYHMITGYYFSEPVAICLFSVIGLIFLALTYLAVIKRFFRKIPVGCAIAGYAILPLICGVWYNTFEPYFYEGAISSGFAFTLMGAYFLVSSNIFTKDKLSIPRTALSSLFFGLAVMSRPTLGVYAVCAYIIYALNVKNASFISEEKSKKSRRIAYALAGALPLAALGIVQMAYNYARFGSPLDFGIQYSLTINDFTHSEFHLSMLLLGMFHYLFAPPLIGSAYPFITAEFSYFAVNGYYYRCLQTVPGIIFLALPVLGWLYIGKAVKKLPDRRSRINGFAAVLLPCLIMPLVIISAVWESGYAIRYIDDFAWEMVLGALIILFFLYEKTSDMTRKAYFRKFMAISFVAAFAVNITQIFYYSFDQNNFTLLCADFEQMIAFWK